MSVNLRRLNEDQLWRLYGQQVENTAQIRREIKRRLSVPHIRLVRRNKERKINFYDK